MQLSRFCPAALVALPFLTPCAALAQGPVDLVVDINTQLANVGGSQPRFVATDGIQAYFWTSKAGGLSELWRSDGTAPGTHRILADLEAYSLVSPFNTPDGVVLASGRAVFVGPSGFDPWGTDGTAAGTQALAPATEDLLVLGDMVSFAGEAWFVATNLATNEYRLWRTDGTPAGTRPAFDASAAEPPSVSGPLVAGGGQLHFASQHDPDVVGDAGTIYRTDGSGASPAPVFVGPTDQILSPGAWIAATSRLLVKVDPSGAVAGGWWAADATSAELLGTAELGASNWAVSSGSRAFFVGQQAIGGNRLFATDGTLGGTVLTGETHPGQSIDIVGFTRGVAYQGGVVFSANIPTLGFEPAFTDGTATGLLTLADATSGSAGSGINEFVGWNGEVYFSTGGTFWRTNGPTGAVPIPGGSLGGPAPIYGVGVTQAGVVFSFESAPTVGEEPWIVNDLGVGIVIKLGAGQTANSSPAALARLGQRAFLSATDGVDGFRPWMSDGTAAGTGPLFPGGGGPATALPALPVRLGDRILFRAEVAGFGQELVITDGTAAGTLTVDLVPGPDGSNPGRLTRVGDLVYFVAYAEAGGNRLLWRSDGTAAGTEKVSNVRVQQSFYGGDDLVFEPAEGLAGVELFFVGVDAGGTELWRTDGTAGGTQRVLDIVPGAGSSYPSGGEMIDGRLFFTANDSVHGREVWTSDGTPQGTVLVVDHVPGSKGSAEISFDTAAFQGSYVFYTRGEGLTPGPLAVDAQSGVVRSLMDPALVLADPALTIARHGGFEVFAGALYFTPSNVPIIGAFDPLYRTTTVTQFAQPMGLAANTIAPRFADVGDGHALFAGSTANGPEPWALDPAGVAAPLTDLWPGPFSSLPGTGERIGSEVLFAATQQGVGRELARTTVATVGGNVAAPIEGGCAQSGAAARLVPVGRPTLGADFDLRLEGAVPSAPVVWAVDATFAHASVTSPCQSLLPNPVAFALATTDGLGTALLDMAVPNDPALLDLELAFQALIVEVPGPFLGISSLSDGLEVVVGP